MFSKDNEIDSLVAAGRPKLVVLQHHIKIVLAVKQRRKGLITNYIEKKWHMTHIYELQKLFKNQRRPLFRM